MTLSRPLSPHFAFFCDIAPCSQSFCEIDANIFIGDRYMAILPFSRFGCEMPILAHFGEVFVGFHPKYSRILSDLQKAYPWQETRVLAYRSCRSVKKCDRGARWRKQKKKERNSEMWQVTYLPIPPTLQYPHQSSVTDVVNHVKFHKIGSGVGSLRGRHLPFFYT